MIENIEFVVLLAGKSTRNYPQSKGLPHKALMPFGDRKVIDTVMENLVNAGAKYFTFIVSDMQTVHAFENCFTHEGYIETKFQEKGMHEQVKLLQSCYLPAGVKINYVIQDKPLGTGHAVGIAANTAEGRSIAMVLPDDIVLSEKGETVYQRAVKNYKGGNVIITRPVEDPSRWGIVENGRYVEKPKESTSNESGIAMMIFDPVVVKKLQTAANVVEQGIADSGLVGGELAWAHALNTAIEEDEAKQKIKTIPLGENDVYLDCGQIKEYERASLYMLIKNSIYKEEHKESIKKWIAQ